MAVAESKDMSGDLSQFRKEILNPPNNPGKEFENARLEPEESRQLHADLFEHAPVGYFVFNRKGFLEKVNQTGARMLGHEKDKLETKPVLHCFVKTSHSKFFDHLARVSLMRQKQSCHLELLRADGTTFHAHFVTSPVTDSSGDFIHFRTIVVDISSRR